MEKFKITLDTIAKLNKFVGACGTIKGEVNVKQGRFIVDGKSIMGLMSLDLSEELNCEVTTECMNDLFDRFKEVGI